MLMRSQPLALRPALTAKGYFFGARGDACSCDPCDCNPCRCGDALVPTLPRWRVSGGLITEGMAGAIPLAGLVLLSLAQPVDKSAGAAWEEILLLDQQTSLEQLEALLKLFDHGLESLPAELGPQPPTLRAVYRVPLTYTHDEHRPWLRVAVTPELLVPVRTSPQAGHSWPQTWLYDGPMARRETFAYVASLTSR